MRVAIVAGLALVGCGRVGFDARVGDSDATPTGDEASVDVECGGAGQGTVALFTFDGMLGVDATGNHSGAIRGDVVASGSHCGTGAARFDTGYVLVPDSAAFDLPTGSISMFVRLSTIATSDNQTFFARDAQNEDLDGHFLILVTPAGELIVRLQNGGDNIFRCAAGFPMGQWVHVGVSFGGTTSQGLRLWVDGVESTTAAGTFDNTPIDCTEPTAAGIAGNNNPIVIGANNNRDNSEGELEPTTTQHVVDGEIDHVHVRAVWRDFSR